MNSKKLITIVIAIICCVVAVIVHEMNLASLEAQNGHFTELIPTADEASYLRPPQNWLEGKGWKDSSVGHSSYVQRPPGYGLVYLVCKLIFPQNPFILLKGVQILAFFFSVVFLAKILFETTKSTKTGLIGALIYGLLPCYNGFMYYTLTESLTPFILLLLTHEFIAVVKQKKPPFLFGLAVAFLLLLRPQLIVFPLIYVVFLLLQSRKFWWVYFLSVVPFLMWQVRNFNITGSASLHPIYSTTNKSIYRPPHQALSNLFRIWEYRSDRFHETVGVLTRDTSSINLIAALQNVPQEHREMVKPILKDFQYVAFEQNKMFQRENKIRELPVEEEFVQKTNALRKQIISSNRIKYYISTPIKSAVELMTKSHLNLFVFQQPWRGNILVEVLRYICLIVINLSLIASILILFTAKTSTHFKLIALSVIITLFYYVFIQRLNEERYMTPLLPTMYVGLIIVVTRVKYRLMKN